MVLVLSAPLAMAEDHEYTWSVSPYFGLHQPSLTALNRQEFAAPYEGTGTIINQLGAGDDRPFSYNTPMPPLNPGTMGGLEFRFRLNDKHAFIMGAATWEATSYVSTTGSMPVQGEIVGISTERKGDMSYTEYYFGWRYSLLNKPKKYGFFATASLHQVYDLNYQESFSMVYVSGPAVTFRKSIVTTAHGTGLPLIQGTAGGEWFLADWLSIGLEGGYEFGLKRFNLENGVTNTDILDTDNLVLKAPVVPDANGRITYKSKAGGAYQDLKLDFDGWKVMIKATLYY